MKPARIAELIEPFLGLPEHSPGPSHSEERRANKSAVLSAAQLQSISIYIDILLHWNTRINLTAIRDPEGIVTRHFGESLFAARHLFPSRSCQARPPESPARAILAGSSDDAGHRASRISVADLGSGAGFPGLPIKLWVPDVSLTLIESNHKKAVFLREVTRALTLTDVNIQNARAETLPASEFDVVTLRAVEHFDAILPTAARLVAPRGRLALLIASSQLPHARSAVPQFSWLDPLPISLSRSRILAIGERQPVPGS